MSLALSIGLLCVCGPVCFMLLSQPFPPHVTTAHISAYLSRRFHSCLLPSLRPIHLTVLHVRTTVSPAAAGARCGFGKTRNAHLRICGSCRTTANIWSELELGLVFGVLSAFQQLHDLQIRRKSTVRILPVAPSAAPARRSD